MKRVRGGTRVVKGIVTMNSYSNKIQLFDGEFTSGYRITGFWICPREPTNSEEIVAMLSTENRGAVPSSVDFSSNIDVGFYLWNTPNQTEGSHWNLIVEDTMVVRDLFFSCYSTGDDTHCNYYITLEKYEFTAWDGALTMVKNKSQAVDGS